MTPPGIAIPLPIRSKPKFSVGPKVLLPCDKASSRDMMLFFYYPRLMSAKSKKFNGSLIIARHYTQHQSKRFGDATLGVSILPCF